MGLSQPVRSGDGTTVVTGAAGLLGRALARRLCETGDPSRVRLVDRSLPPAPDRRCAAVVADLTDPAALAGLVAGAACVIHLAAMPGGAAEADPAAARAINLDATLNLAAALEPGTRFVCAGSVAVFGDPLPSAVDDETPPRPASAYGAYKQMVEIALADAARRGAVDALVLRLPGIVARPGGGGGFRSAFMSDVVAAMATGDACTLPVGPDATLWLMSVQCCVDNLLHAAHLNPIGTLRVLTLPTLRVTISRFVTALADATGHDAAAIHYAPDPAIEAAFGRLPPIATPAAELLGFRHDQTIHLLARNALAGLAKGSA